MAANDITTICFRNRRTLEIIKEITRETEK